MKHLSIILVMISIISIGSIMSSSAEATLTLNTIEPDLIGYPGQYYRYDLITNEPSIILSQSSWPAWADVPERLLPNTYHMDGYPNFPGNYEFRIGLISTTTQTILWKNWTVNIVGQVWSPSVTSEDKLNGYVGQMYHYQMTLNESGYISIPSPPSWLSYATTGLYLEGVPSESGVYNIAVKIHPDNDPQGYVYSWHNWTITIAEMPSSGFSSEPYTTGIINSSYIYFPSLISSLNDTEWGIIPTVLPSWAGFDTIMYNAPIIYGTPDSPGSFHFKIVAVLYTGNILIPYSTIAWQNWTVTVFGTYDLFFTNDPSINGILRIPLNDVWQYTPMTNHVSDISFIEGPSWLAFKDGIIKGSTNNEGRYSITVIASDGNGTTTMSFDVIVEYNPSSDLPSIWLTVIPLVLLFITALLCSFTREGVYGYGFMGGLAIAITVMTWTGAIPSWVIVISAIILFIMFWRTFNEQ